ncbi:MAG: Mg-chelatase subunit ChlD [Phycisphaerales bacterium]|nr:Mg-chelatase subunit ChlD [Phycisphaerales bacterium]
MSCCRWSGVGFGLELLLMAVIGAGGCKQKQGDPAATVKAATTTAASGPVTAGAGDAGRTVDLTVLPDPVRQALSGGTAGGGGGRMGAAWSGGEVAFTNEQPVFRIARDYDQELAVPVRSRSAPSRRVVATLEPFGGELLGDFVGAGSADRPLDLTAGGEGMLALHLYAQDAARASYRTTAFLRDAQSGEVLAASPVTVFVARPKFSVSAKVGEQEAGTLGRTIKVHNDGETLTDFSVRAGSGLEGRILFQPLVEHAELRAGQTLTFTVMPRLATDFTKAEGALVLSGAGQERREAVGFALPPGMRVFVATSFSTTDSKASGTYCTNNPNTNTPIGGPTAPATDPFPLIGYDPSDPRQKHFHDGTPLDGGKGSDEDDQGPIGRLADYLNTHLSARGIPGTNIDTNGRVKIGAEGFGVKVSSDTGAAKGSDPTGPLVDTNYTVKVGPVTVVKGTGTVSISPQVADQVNVNSNSTPTGKALNNAVGGGAGGVQGGPRGLRVREDYAAFRRSIYHNNEPESVVAVGAGTPAERVILQTWHSDRWCLGTGRQIILRLWDGTGSRRISREIMLTDSNTFGQWPAALALPDGRALVVWETSRTWHGPPRLAYRVSTYGYGNWSEQRAIAGGDDPAGNYDPMPVMGADGIVRIFWQRGRGTAAKIFSTHGTDAGELTPAAEVKGLPAGATRPVVRAGADGSTMHLVCTVESSPPKVVYGISHDGGATFERVTALSPAALDCGDADLLVAGDGLQCAFRAGPAWESRIFHTASHDGGKTWSEAKAVTAADQYAEYPVLVDRGAGATELRYHGGARTDRALVGAAGAAAAPPTRAILKQFALASDGQAWSAPRRLLTDFPAVQAAWLEVAFNLRTPRGQYSPHEISVLLNGQPLIHQVGVIPEGTYLLPIDPALLASDANGLGQNTIGLRTVHMSPGHYQSAANFRLQARHAFRETLVVADTQEAADALAAGESESINHGRADVGVFARFVEAPQTPALIPASPKQGEIITLPLRVGNIGEAAASGVVVRVYASGPDREGKFTSEAVGEALNLGDLAPLAVRDVEVKFPYGGAERYYVVSTHGGADFDSSNDVHQVSFAVAKAPSIRAIEADGNQPIVAMVSDDPAAPFRLRILDAKSGKEVARVEQGALRGGGNVPPGTYRLAMQRYEYEGQEVTFPDEVERRENQPLRASLRTAVEVEFATWAPQPFRWELVRADKPDQIVQWLYGEHAMMLVPPGDYRLAMKPTEYGSNRVVWPEVIHLERDAHRVVKLDGGVAPPAMLARRATPFRWGLWRVGDGPEKAPLQIAAGDWRAIAAPPGRYHWGVQPLEYKSIVAMFPAVEVKAGELTRPEEAAIFVLTPSKWSGVPYAYSLVDPRTKKAVQRIWNGGLTDLYVPAGEYDVHVQPTEYKSREVVMAKGVRLTGGREVRMMLDSGVELAAAAAGITAPWQVTFYREGNAKEIVQQLRGATWGATPLPAGSYRVGIKAEEYRGQELVSPRAVVVTAGKVTLLKLDKGMGVTQAVEGE